MKKRGFTLIELLAVIVVLAIILAISIPTIIGLIENSRKNSFASSTKLVVGRALTAKSQDDSIDVASINTSNVDSILGVENNNFSSLSIEKDGEEDLYATIVGQGKFNGFTACGTEDDVTVEKTGEEVVCEVAIICTTPTDLTPTDSVWFVFDSSTGTITGINWEYYNIHQSDPVPVTFPSDLIIPSKIDGVTVTTIGSGAFSGQWNNGNVSNLVIPSTIKTIGNYAFRRLNITSVNIPSGVEEIGEGAFYYNQISCLSLPKNLKTIGSIAFRDNQLAEVSIPINVETIGASAFYGNQIVSAKIKNGAIGSGAFRNNQISDLVIGDKVSIIGEEAFNTNQISNVEIGPNIEYIGAYAFYNNQIVNDLVVPATVNYVGAYAFSFGSNAAINLTVDTDLQNIGSTAFYAYSSSNLTFNNINIKSGPINSGVFGISGSSNKITNLNIGSGVTSIASCAFNGGYPIDNVTIESGTILPSAFSCGYNIKKVTLGSGVTSVGNGAFAGNQINSLTIDEGVTSFGQSAFASNQITDVKLPSSLVSLGEGAFQNNMLTSVTLPSSLAAIGPSVFKGNQITSIDLPSTLVSIDASAFENNQLVNLTIPAVTTTLGDNSFKTNLLDSITIGGDQNKFNSRWSDIGFPLDLMPGFTYASCFTFDSGTITAYNSECRKKVNIPSEINGVAVTTIGDHAFDGLGITSVTIPEGVTHIGDYAFFNDSLAYDLTIPSSVTYIGPYAFSFGSNIAIDVTINANLENTNNYAFFGYSSTNVTFKNLTIEHGNILSSTFGGMNITNLKLGSGVALIDSCAFGGGDQVTNINIASGVVGNGAFSCGNNVKTLTLGSGVTSIGSAAFTGNQLTSVNIPESTTTIGGGAFAGNQISNLVLHNGLVEISGGAFYGNQLTSLVIPASVKTIDGGAFENNQIANLTLPSSVTYLGGGAFNNNQLPSNSAIIYARNENGTIDNTKIVSYGGANRTNVVIPSGVTTIGDSAFASNDIQNIDIPNTVVTIEESAFYTNSLTNLTIPANVVTIGDDAFTDNQLTEINILGNATRYDDRWLAIGFPMSLMPTGAYATSCFTFDNTNGIISGYNDECRKNVDIPSTIGGYTVNAIADWTFNNKGITSVTVADGITTIGVGAFQNNPITSATLPNTLTTINQQLFYGTQLTGIIIPSSVTSIDNWAFAYNPISSLTIPNSVTYIGNAAFIGAQLTSLTIPNSVLNIVGGAFSSNAVLNSVSIGSNIQSIGDIAFQDCPSLQTISINNTRTNVSTMSGYNSKWGAPNATLGCSGESLYSIANSDSNTSIVSQGYNNDTIMLKSNKVGQPVSSFKVDGTLISGNTFVMPAQAVTITDITYQAASVTLESSHPYPDSYNYTWSKTVDGATSLSVVFDSQTMVENNYDVIYVYDVSNTLIATYTGGSAAGVTLTVPGNTVKIKLTSDGSVNYYGFKCTISGL